MLDQPTLAGEFEDWIIPAIINDFKKNEKAGLEFNRARVDTMRQSFIEGSDWDYHIAEINRMEQLTKDDVSSFNKYLETTTCQFIVWMISTIPPVEKPQIDPVTIDPTRQSEFAANILAAFDEIEPAFVEADADYRVIEFAEGVDLYYAPNPLNDLFTFSIGVEVGTEETKNSDSL